MLSPLDRKSLKIVLPIMGVLYALPPLLFSYDKGQKREGGTDARDALPERQSYG